jgi:hypothetical protein
MLDFTKHVDMRYHLFLMALRPTELKPQFKAVSKLGSAQLWEARTQHTRWSSITLALLAAPAGDVCWGKDQLPNGQVCCSQPGRGSCSWTLPTFSGVFSSSGWNLSRLPFGGSPEIKALGQSFLPLPQGSFWGSLELLGCHLGTGGTGLVVFMPDKWILPGSEGVTLQITDYEWERRCDRSGRVSVLFAVTTHSLIHNLGAMSIWLTHIWKTQWPLNSWLDTVLTLASYHLNLRKNCPGLPQITVS